MPTLFILMSKCILSIFSASATNSLMFLTIILLCSLIWSNEWLGLFNFHGEKILFRRVDPMEGSIKSLEAEEDLERL